MQIAIQGTQGSFHDQAAHTIDPHAQIIPCTTFADVFRAVTQGEASHGLVAIENNLHGSINEVYRLLDRQDVWIVNDLRMHITQNLIGHEGVTLSELADSSDAKVYSQGPALAQVELWLDEHLPNATRIEMHDTAESVRLVMEQDDPHQVAVAGTHAARTYSGNIIAPSIQDDAQNFTRFILFQKDKTLPHDATHASVILTTDHTPGALLRALTIFADAGLNLTKLDSHPIPGDMRHYVFYIDYDLPTKMTNDQLLELLDDQGCHAKLLGEYVSVEC